MGRKRNKISRKTKPALAFVVDGETEVWYLQMLKRNERSLRVDIKPEIPVKKSLQEQYDFICNLSTKEYTKVFWIVDLDTVVKEARETPKGKENPIVTFKRFRNNLKKIENVVVIVNNPCLEFWFLLHFERTSRIFSNCSDAEKQLKVHLKNYEKKQKFFTKQDDDIYLKLKTYLNTAIENAVSLGQFDSENPEKAMCEMELFFHAEELNGYFSKKQQ